MLKIKEYVKVNSLEEAYELNQKKSSRVLGGMVWMKMMNRRRTMRKHCHKLVMMILKANHY